MDADEVLTIAVSLFVGVLLAIFIDWVWHRSLPTLIDRFLERRDLRRAMRAGKMKKPPPPPPWPLS